MHNPNSQLDHKLLKKAIENMVGRHFSIHSVDGTVQTIPINSYSQAKEEIAFACDISKNHMDKLLRGALKKCPRERVMQTLEKNFHISFYLVDNQQLLYKEAQITMNNLSKQALCSMYAAVINFFNSNDIDSEEDYFSLLSTLESYELAVPDPIYKKFYNYIEEHLGDNLPPLETSDLNLENNVISDEETFNQLLYRHVKRTHELQRNFVSFAKENFSLMVQG